ncbi:MAG: hypothetical protein R3E18_09815 [Sphingomonadaceae bacterium]
MVAPAALFVWLRLQIAEGKVEKGLLRAGLSPANSACMAERMVDRLSITQLRKLERLQARKGNQPGRSPRPICRTVSRVGDAELPVVTIIALRSPALRASRARPADRGLTYTHVRRSIAAMWRETIWCAGAGRRCFARPC